MENMAFIFCTWRIWVMEKFEIRLGFASPNFKFFHNPYSPSAEYEAIFSITRHQPGGICTNIHIKDISIGKYLNIFEYPSHPGVNPVQATPDQPRQRLESSPPPSWTSAGRSPASTLMPSMRLRKQHLVNLHPQ